MARSNATSRRDFLRHTCPAATLLALGVFSGCDSSAMSNDGESSSDGTDGGIQVNGNVITRDLTGSRVKVLQKSGGFLLINSALTVVIKADGEIRAFTSICTHQGCDVYAFQSSRLMCPCHGSEYNTQGQVVAGPAPSPLKKFSVSQSGDIVTITTSN